ncbi:MAG: hypothetical protein QXZ12_08250, partial [Thermoplasmata archaeon]
MLVADIGFYSANNIKKMVEHNIHYVILLKRNSKLILYGIEMKRYFMFENRAVWYSYVFKRMKVYLFKVPSLRVEVEKDFLKRSRRRRNAVTTFHRIENKMGTITVVTDLNVSGEILYDMFKFRVYIKQAYDTFKNTLDADRSYMRKNYAM